MQDMLQQIYNSYFPLFLEVHYLNYLKWQKILSFLRDVQFDILNFYKQFTTSAEKHLIRKDLWVFLRKWKADDHKGAIFF